MKKMIVIAALIGGMLMPAQMMAKNDRGNAKPRVENRDNRKGDRKEYRKDYKDNKKGYNDNRNYKKNDRYGKPDKIVVVNKPQRPVVIVNKPAPRLKPAPRPRRDCCDNDVANVVGAVGAFVGIVGLLSLVAQ